MLMTWQVQVRLLLDCWQGRLCLYMCKQPDCHTSVASKVDKLECAAAKDQHVRSWSTSYTLRFLMPKKACDASAGIPPLLLGFSTALVHKPDTQKKRPAVLRQIPCSCQGLHSYCGRVAATPVLDTCSPVIIDCPYTNLVRSHACACMC
jgi:hypothetical protein